MHQTQIKYVIFAITVRNDRLRGESSVLYNNYRFTLIDLAGRSYSHASETYGMSDYQSSSDVYPGTRAGGAIAFEISSNTAPDQIIHDFVTTPQGLPSNYGRTLFTGDIQIRRFC
jgi:hypothetical protein